MRLYLVRHGQTEWNASGRAQGHSDVGLDGVGLAQAERLGEHFAGINVKRVVSSDLQRCVTTAGPVASGRGLVVESREDLRERTFGELEGSHYTDIRAYFAAESRVRGLGEHEIRPVGGESLRDVWNRLTKVTRMIENSRESLVVVGHGGTNGLLLARLIRGTVQTARAFRFENASVTELVRRPDGHWQLVRYCDTRHLVGIEKGSPGRLSGPADSADFGGSSGGREAPGEGAAS